MSYKYKTGKIGSYGKVDDLNDIHQPIKDMETTKIVIWKDGSYKIILEGLTWEYENDIDWLTTITLP